MSLKEQLAAIENKYRTIRMLNSSAEHDMFNFDDAERENVRHMVCDFLHGHPLIKKYFEGRGESLEYRFRAFAREEFGEDAALEGMVLVSMNVNPIFGRILSSSVTKDIAAVVGSHPISNLAKPNRRLNALFYGITGANLAWLGYALLGDVPINLFLGLAGLVGGIIAGYKRAPIPLIWDNLKSYLDYYFKVAREADTFLDKEVKPFIALPKEEF